MRESARRAVVALLPVIAILLFWTTQAAWGRGVVDGTRYKFDLTGVAKISNPDSPAEARDHCTWYESPASRRHCGTTPTETNAYELLELAPGAAALSILAFVAIAWMTARERIVSRGRTLLLISMGGALSMFVAIQLLTRNVGRAVAIYAGHGLEMRGSGLTTAWLVVALFTAAAALTVASNYGNANAAAVPPDRL